MWGDREPVLYCSLRNCTSEVERDQDCCFHWEGTEQGTLQTAEGDCYSLGGLISSFLTIQSGRVPKHECQIHCISSSITSQAH